MNFFILVLYILSLLLVYPVSKVFGLLLIILGIILYFLKIKIKISYIILTIIILLLNFSINIFNFDFAKYYIDKIQYSYFFIKNRNSFNDMVYSYNPNQSLQLLIKNIGDNHIKNGTEFLIDNILYNKSPVDLPYNSSLNYTSLVAKNSLELLYNNKIDTLKISNNNLMIVYKLSDHDKINIKNKIHDEIKSIN